jgi:formate dehydrogenase
MQQDRWDTDLLTQLGTAMVDASICGLGQAAPNPIKLVIKHFPEEVS